MTEFGKRERDPDELLANAKVAADVLHQERERATWDNTPEQQVRVQAAELDLDRAVELTRKAWKVIK